jgi:shikimate dehydrogenase
MLAVQQMGRVRSDCGHQGREYFKTNTSTTRERVSWFQTDSLAGASCLYYVQELVFSLLIQSIVRSDRIHTVLNHPKNRPTTHPALHTPGGSYMIGLRLVCKTIGAKRAVDDSSLQEVVCIIGQPVAGNPAQYVMERTFAAAGLDWRYLTFNVAPEDLGDAILGMRAMGFRGANVTLPHKIEVIPLLDRLSEAAESIGAVNLIVREGDELVGENLDGKAFIQALADVVEPQGKNYVVLGAGGAARAIAVELALAGAGELTIVNRTAATGEALVEHINKDLNVPATFTAWQGDYVVPDDADILINATTIGMGEPDARVPLAWKSVRPELIVADIVYSPPETKLLRDAKAAGVQTIDGLGMLVHRAVICFQHWTGVEPDVALMRDSIEEFLGA